MLKVEVSCSHCPPPSPWAPLRNSPYTIGKVLNFLLTPGHQLERMVEKCFWPKRDFMTLSQTSPKQWLAVLTKSSLKKIVPSRCDHEIIFFGEYRWEKNQFFFNFWIFFSRFFLAYKVENWVEKHCFSKVSDQCCLQVV